MFKIIYELVGVQTDVIRTGDSRKRGSNRLYQPVAQKDVYKFSFFPRTIREWNLFPASVTDADKLEEFRGRIQNLPEPVGLAIVVYATALTGLLQSLRFLRMKPIVLLALETVLSMCLDYCKSTLMVTQVLGTVDNF
jgi:hypothetical protein